MLNEQDSYHLNLSPIVPEARGIVRAAAITYLQHLGQWCIGVLIHGSALKGGYIPGCSDIDFQVYLESAAFDSRGNLPLEIGINIQRDLAMIDIAPFQYIQGYALLQLKRQGFTGPIPGAYHMITGTLPVPEATEEELQIAARKALEKLDVANVFHPQDLLECGDWKLPQKVRWLCTDVWPTLYHVLTIQQGDGIGMWQLSKHEAMKRLPQESVLAQTIQAFYQAVSTYYSVGTSVEDAFEVIQTGLTFLQSVQTWWSDINSD
ncbi:MAG TPA: hypothetical protein VNG51_03425 [Ktedonobacteraceae bacterium]|nr:hypothetical protein [Ktedonobacteraceae bacterium]